MGRYFIELDPDGYSYASEPGFDYWITGRDLLAKWMQSGLDAGGFYNPPGSDWLMCRPRQFAPEWYADDRLSDHVLDESLWSFDAALSVAEFPGFTKKPSGTGYPDNKWLAISIPDDFVPVVPWTFDWDALADAAGVTLPTGMTVIGAASTAPAGPTDLTDHEHGISPHVQALLYPAPDDVLCFGFGQYACLLYPHVCYVLRSENNDRETWSLVGKGTLTGQRQFVNDAVRRAASTPTLFSGTAPTAEIRGFSCIQVGEKELFFYFGGDPISVAMEDDRNGVPFLEGEWWVAGFPGQKLTFQAQAVGYEEADALLVNAPTQILFDFGEVYQPTEDPTLTFGKAFAWVTPPATAEGYTAGPGAEFRYAGDANNYIEAQVSEEMGGVVWESDGTKWKGSLHARLIPATNDTTTAGAYLCPQLHSLLLKFPVVLTPRQNTPFVLNDTKWQRWRVEADLRDPLAKQISIALTPEAANLLVAVGFHERTDFPVHILEDTDGDGVGDTVRVAGWVKDLNLEEIRLEGLAPYPTIPVRAYEFTAGALLTQADELPLYLPQLVNPTAPDDESGNHGYIEHTYAVQQILLRSGIDTADPSFYYPYADPWTGTAVARLPGTWALQSGKSGTKNESPWAQDWDENNVEFCLRIARNWRGWVLYETLGSRVRYHGDLLFDLLIGAAYIRSATLYRYRAEAAAAGAPDQVMLVSPKRHTPPLEGNCVRVTGKDDETALMPHIIDRDLASVSDTTAENFIGRPKPVALVLKEAVSAEAAKQLARIKRLQVARKRVLWTAPVPLAPWHMVGDVELGQVVEFKGRGDCLITHLEVECLKSHPTASYVKTTITGERVPSGLTAGDPEEVTELYPGAYNPNAEEEA